MENQDTPKPMTSEEKSDMWGFFIFCFLALVLLFKVIAFIL